MPVEVVIPDVGQPSGEVTILKWLKRVGEEVRQGEVLFEAETDKAVLPIEATISGVLREIRYKEGAVVPVLTPVALITLAGEGEAVAAPTPSVPVVTPGPAEDLVARHIPTLRRHRPGWVMASPVARRLAMDKGVNLAMIRGSGPHGRILKKDVLAFLTEMLGAAPATLPLPAAAPEDKIIPISATRRTIAGRMTAAWSTTPQVTLMTEADAVALAELRARLQADLGEELGLSISYTDLLVKIVAVALRQHPQVNARLEGDSVRLVSQVHVGVAVDTERGLLVPVIRNADLRGVGQIARELRDLAERARSGQIGLEELSGSTFTITNLGMYGVDAFTPIINSPEAAVLGVGRVVRKPVEHQGKLCLRERVVLSLTFDHRLLDGGPAARFLQRVSELVEKPHLLLV
jgi:pyruvate dehydrogenase E2 component (dihydrolipoamide acetyltransferase)